MYYKDIIIRESLDILKKHLIVLSQRKSVFNLETYNSGKIAIKGKRRNHYSSLCYSILICEQRIKIKVLNNNVLSYICKLSKRNVNNFIFNLLSKPKERFVFYTQRIKNKPIKKKLDIKQFIQDDDYLEYLLGLQPESTLMLFDREKKIHG